MKVLLVIPPFTQINTTYPSVLQLSGYLNSQGYKTISSDLSLKVILRLLSKDGLNKVFDEVANHNINEESIKRMLLIKDQYINKIDIVIEFLQGKNLSSSKLILKEGFLPHGDSFAQQVDEEKVFGDLGEIDKAKYYASLFIDDLVKVIQTGITSNFGLSRYAERLSSSTADFNTIETELNRPLNIIDKFIEEETEKIVAAEKPDIIGYSIAFPGNLFGALISARFIKSKYPDMKIVFGGGYINTELRSLKDPSIFRYTDFITLDDGELPLLNILRNSENHERSIWTRTFCMNNGNVEYLNNSPEQSVKHNELYPPNLNGINPKEYISLNEMANPMHRLWSDGYWNKLTLAHGCYWHKCAFCDTTLDYIKRYSPAKAKTVVDWMESLIEQTNIRAFHFTDEAAPPSLLKELAVEIIKRKLEVVWWGNIRFEKSFTMDLCLLLKASGCIAVSGGVEVADERLLKLINKGITIQQVSAVFHNFQSAGIMVHTYLMYGFPSQTEQETINSLEIVRQLFENGLIQSGFWHQFALTIHSPISIDVSKYGVEILSSKNNKFANNDLVHKDLSGCNHSKFSNGLKKAIYNYMHNVGFDFPLSKWFNFDVPKSSINIHLIAEHLASLKIETPNPKSFSIWLAEKPVITRINSYKSNFMIYNNSLEGDWEIDNDIALWLENMICRTIEEEKVFYSDWAESFPTHKISLTEFTRTEIWNDLREHVLLFV